MYRYENDIYISQDHYLIDQIPFTHMNVIIDINLHVLCPYSESISNFVKSILVKSSSTPKENLLYFKMLKFDIIFNKINDTATRAWKIAASKMY